MGSDVGSHAIALRIGRLYVLTWILAWCGVFLVLSAYLSHSSIYIISCHISEGLSIPTTFTTGSIGMNEYSTIILNHSCVVRRYRLSEPSKSGQIHPIP